MYVFEVGSKWVTFTNINVNPLREAKSEFKISLLASSVWELIQFSLLCFVLRTLLAR